MVIYVAKNYSTNEYLSKVNNEEGGEYFEWVNNINDATTLNNKISCSELISEYLHTSNDVVFIQIESLHTNKTYGEES